MYRLALSMRLLCPHADGALCPHKTNARLKCFTYWGGDRKNVSKKLNNSLKHTWLPLHLMLTNGSDKSIQHVVSFWFMRKSYLDCILAEPDQRKAVRDPQSAVATILSLNSLIHCPLYH